MVHPRTVATSATIAVIAPIKKRATKNEAQPPALSPGGMQANRTFHPMHAKWTKAS